MRKKKASPILLPSLIGGETPLADKCRLSSPFSFFLSFRDTVLVLGMIGLFKDQVRGLTVGVCIYRYYSGTRARHTVLCVEKRQERMRGGDPMG